MTVLMAKKGTGRPRGRYIRGNVDERIAITTLGSETAAIAVFDDSVKERSLISSLVVSVAMRDYTPAAGVGPIMVGISHSDYTAAEIEAFIEQSGSWNEGDKVAQEVAKRQIRMLGQFETAGLDATQEAALNDGMKFKTKLNWILNAGQTLNLWAYNSGSAAVSTTVPDIEMEGHANLWAL